MRRSQQKQAEARMHKRKRRKTLQLLLLLTSLLGFPCDTAALQEEQEETVGQRLAAEPEEVLALQGQPAQLACLVDGKQGKVSWLRNGMTLVYEDQVLPSYSKRLRLASSDQPELGPSPPPPVANCSLQLRSASLRDDGLYQCRVSAGGGRPLESRPARLTVLVPPTRLRLLHQASWPAGADREQPALRPEPIEEDEASVVVRQGARLRLLCRSDPAKPAAELAWLDHESRLLRSSNSSNGSNSSSPQSALALAAAEPELRPAELAHTLTVQRHHHNQLFACQATHLAFRQPAWPHLFERPLIGRLRLDVWHEPEIELVLSARPVLEHQPLQLQCLVQANPMQGLRYLWTIDGLPVANATESQLRIASATRQLHQREIRCQATNQVGSSSASLRLQVRYGPRFAGQLLGPDSASGQLQVTPASPSAANWPLGPHELRLARQLALTFQEGQDLPIQCQFEANPRAHQVAWFRTSTNFSTMRDVQPQEADELIGLGYARATFRAPRAPQARLRRLCGPAEQAEVNQGGKDAQNQRASVDYEQMSRELESELEYLRASQQLDSIPSEPSSSQLVQLDEEEEEEGWLARANLSLAPAPADPVRLPRREVNLTSSQILLVSAREESVGRYICQTRPLLPSSLDLDLPQPSSFQRALQVVMRRKGRLVSAQEQWAPANSAKLKVECLAQLSNQLEQASSQIQWLKNGEPIELRCREGRSLSLLEERSPDLLFLRSTLSIELAPEISQPAGAFAKQDFGHYNCTLVNGQNQIDDFLTINLREPQPSTGLAFALMGSLAVGSLLLVASLVALLVVCPARGRLSEKLREVAANEQQQQQQSASGKLEAERKSEQQQQQPKADFLANSQGHLSSLNRDDLSAKGATPTLDVNNNNHHHQQAFTPAFGSANEPNLAEGQQQARKLRSSLRHGSSNFAAIHESLEQTLTLGKLPPDACGVEQPPSFVDRLLDRLSGRQGAGRARHLKSGARPQISGPLQSQHLASGGGGGGLMRRASLSTSLSMLGQASEQHGSEAAAARIKSAGHHLVSSSANLIQDSTTASDGTASSSRSSSSQGQNRDPSNPSRQPASNSPLASEQRHHMNGYLNSMYSAAVQHQHQHQHQHQQWQPSDTIDCSLYVNHDGAAYLNQSLQAEEAAANNYCVTQQLPAYSLAAYQDQAWPDQKQLVSQHYQHPDPYYLATQQQQQQQQQPCYSTVCTANKPSYPPPPLPLPLPPSSTANGTANPYGTLPVRPSSHLSGPHLVVPSSDAADAFYETNYGTLCRSSAIKTMGYVITNTAAAAYSTASSSSPNSLSTQNSNTNYHLQSAMTSNQTQSEANHHNTIVQSDGSSTTTTTTTAAATSSKILNDNGQATHV